jgi:TonB family protein
MVRALPNNPWLTADFLERIRPGFALSAALHVGLLMALAYFLAFNPAVQPPPTEQEETFVLRDFPRSVPPTIPPEHSTFTPKEAPPIDEVHTMVGTLPFPPQNTFTRTPTTTGTNTTPPAPEIIKDPRAVYRGGLVYPDKGLEAGASGYVDFSFIIQTDGSVGSPQVIAEAPTGYGFAAAAMKAFPKWRFEPKLIEGKPVAAPAQIRVTFQLK